MLLEITIIPAVHLDVRSSLECMKTTVCYDSAQTVHLAPFNVTYELSICKKDSALELSSQNTAS